MNKQYYIDVPVVENCDFSGSFLFHSTCFILLLSFSFSSPYFCLSSTILSRIVVPEVIMWLYIWRTLNRKERDCTQTGKVLSFNNLLVVSDTNSLLFH